jgi:pyruvate dehydrogenase E1 component alpha subunit
MHVGDMAVGMLPAIAIVGGGAPIAAGMALSARMRRSGQVVASFFGDGGANEGAVHEAMNMAAIWKLPVLFICENNLYGASTSIQQTIAVDHVADRAAGYGMPGIVIDGNDVIAVRNITREAAERARRGDGPTLIECETYRLCGHSRSDACGYRTRDEEALWRDRDPLLVHERRYALGHPDLADIERDVEAEIDAAVAFAEASPEPAPEDTLLHVFWEGE